MPILNSVDIIIQWFLQILNMTFTATIVIIIISVARVTVFKKLPKIYPYVLWSVVLFRLICPFTMESSMSIFHMNNYKIYNEETIEKYPISHDIFTDDVVTVEITIVNQENILLITSLIWIIGVIFMILKGYISFCNLKKTVSNSKTINGLYSNVYVSKNISTAMVIGFIFPRIYLPQHIIHHKSKNFILFHEKIHIKRLDHITRIVSYFALCIHWFNPFVWWAFNLSNNDMEMSCDETVIERFDCKSDYSTSLLNMAVKKLEGGENKNIICSLAFLEGDVKVRIKNVLNYKKPSIVVSIILVITLSVTAYAFGTDPIKENRINSNFINIDMSQEKTDKVIDLN